MSDGSSREAHNSAKHRLMQHRKVAGSQGQHQCTAGPPAAGWMGGPRGGGAPTAKRLPRVAASSGSPGSAGCARAAAAAPAPASTPEVVKPGQQRGFKVPILKPKPENERVL